MPLSHNNLIQLAKTFDHTQVTDGVCQGFVMMGVQAIFCDDEATFFYRLKQIARFAPHNFGVLKEEIKAIRIKISKGEQISAEEEMLQSIPAWLDGVAVYLNPEFYFNQISKDPLNQQNIIQLYQLLRSELLGKSNLEIPLKKILTGNQIEMTRLIKHLEHLLQQTSLTTAIIINSHSHIVHCKYNKKNKKWYYLDTNFLHKQLIPDYVELENPSELVHELFESFSGEFNIFNFRILIKTPEKLAAQTNFDQEFENFKTLCQSFYAKFKIPYSHFFKKNKEKQSVLYFAAEENNIELLKTALSYNPEFLDDTDTKGVTALNLACQYGYLDILEEILTYQPLMNSKNCVVGSALVMHNIKIAERLLAYTSFNLNHRFLRACITGDLEAVKLLLKYGAAPLDPQGYFAPLERACNGGHLEIVKILLAHCTYLMPDQSFLNVPNASNCTLLHYASMSGNLELVRYLRQLGPDNYMDIANKDALFYYACKPGNVALVEYLIAEGANLANNVNSNILLHNACDSKNLFMVEFIIEKLKQINQFNINIKDKLGRTPLHHACDSGNEEIVNLLLSLGADSQLKDEQEVSAMQLALEKNHPLVVQKLLNYDKANTVYSQGNTSLHLACQFGFIDEVKALLKTGASLEQVNDEGNTPLHVAAQQNYPQVVAYLLTLNSPFTKKNNAGNTPLHLACSQGFSAVVAMLVNTCHHDERSGYINTRDDLGLSALHSACFSRDHALIKFLIAEGGNIELTMANGTTLLQLACVFGLKDTVTLLLNLLKQDPKFNINQTNSENLTALENAINSSNFRLIKLLINHGANPYLRDGYNLAPLETAHSHLKSAVAKVLISEDNGNFTCQNGLTTLHIASTFGFKEKVEHLIAQPDVDIHKIDSLGRSPLYLACQNGQYEVVELFLARVNLLIPDTNPHPFLIACENGHYEIVNLFIQSGWGRFTLCNEKGQNALHLACREKLLDIARLLITSQIKNNQSFDINLPDNNEGFTPLHHACKAGNLELINYLLAEGANLGQKIKSGSNVLHLACSTGKLNVAKFLLDPATQRKYLLNQPDALRSKNNFGYTPVHHACRTDNLKLMEFLRSLGFALNLPTDKGITPLHEACTFGSILVAHFLLEQLVKFPKFDINQQNSDGDTALHSVVQRKKSELINIFINQGANPYSYNNEGYSPLYYARYDKDLFASLTSKCDKNQLIQQDIKSNEADSYYEVRIERESDKRTVLHYACSLGLLELVERLLASSETVIDCGDRRGYTPLHLACEHGHLEIVQLLLARNANPNLKVKFERERRNALHLACEKGHLPIVECLFAVKDIELTTSRGETPLHLACNKKNLSLCAYLLQQNIDVSAQNNIGFTALHYACRFGYRDIIQLFINRAKECDIDIGLSKKNEDGDFPLDCIFAINKHEIFSPLYEYARAKNIKIEHIMSLETLQQVNPGLENNSPRELHGFFSNSGQSPRGILSASFGDSLSSEISSLDPQSVQFYFK